MTNFGLKVELKRMRRRRTSCLPLILKWKRGDNLNEKVVVVFWWKMLNKKQYQVSNSRGVFVLGVVMLMRLSTLSTKRKDRESNWQRSSRSNNDCWTVFCLAKSSVIVAWARLLIVRCSCRSSKNEWRYSSRVSLSLSLSLSFPANVAVTTFYQIVVVVVVVVVIAVMAVMLIREMCRSLLARFLFTQASSIWQTTSSSTGQTSRGYQASIFLSLDHEPLSHFSLFNFQSTGKHFIEYWMQ